MTKTRTHASRLGAWVAASLTLLLACSPQASDGKDRKPSAKTPAVTPASDEPESAEGNQSEDADDEAIAEDDGGVLEIEAGSGEVAGNVVPVTPIQPKQASVVWREAASPASPVEFVYVTSGVVGRSSGGYVELDEKDGQLFLRPDLEIPKAELIGRWPSDVWAVERTTVGDHVEVRVLRFDGNGSWEPREYDKKQRWTDEGQSYRKGWRAGFLVREGSGLTRLGSAKVGPKVGPRMGKIVLEVFEAVGGDVYHVSERTNGIYVQGRCETRRCVEQNAKLLPFGSDWRFGTQVPRLRNSISVFANIRVDDTDAHYLLHYETGGWKLEALIHTPSGMWPDGDGGLWVSVKDKLWYRDPRGEWFDVALPKGAGHFSAAMRGDQSELWLATVIDGKPRVFATAAVMRPDDAGK